MMRGGHLDVCVLGAFQVSVDGDLANWHTGEADAIPAVGGAMDLAIGARQTWVMMPLLTRAGESKLVARCSYPLTARACVSRVYTDHAVLDITGDRIVAIGNLADAASARRIDAAGLAVAPGFINVLSWADEALIADGRSQGNIRQGVTMEIFGEGRSRGPLNDAMRAEALTKQDYGPYPITWTTLDEFLRWLAARGERPSTRRPPDCGCSRPRISFSSVLLPSSFGPTMPRNSPSATCRSIPDSVGTLP